jgi:hypothetical protein
MSWSESILESGGYPRSKTMKTVVVLETAWVQENERGEILGQIRPDFGEILRTLENPLDLMYGTVNEFL